MAKRIIEGIEVEISSGNVFADLGLPDADKLKIKSGLVIEITKAMRKLDLTQEEAARRMGITQPKVSGMLRGDFANLSERKLMDCLNRLGYDIEIKVKPSRRAGGPLDAGCHLRQAFAAFRDCPRQPSLPITGSSGRVRRQPQPPPPPRSRPLRQGLFLAPRHAGSP